ncbi:ABC transporter permease [Paenibacillus sp. LHD-117]|uniref:ABC transporter permease n=1 Tax=Paenibacillus sp. LHD-117 TaxID=3071412 RepID=UPI0027E15EE7|nr:ABC transporter permease [Paenibacillus sp. LHD-117]MDQ6418931.1 ABC transporter permease [Paenibacillus sp. LHD-117]
MDIIGNLINGTLVFATAFIFAALGGLISERAGVINIGLEGFMVSGAFFAAVVAHYGESAGLGAFSPWLGVIGAFVCTAVFSAIHAVATIRFKANQVVSGVVINILAASSTFYLVKMIFDGSAETPLLTHVFHKLAIPSFSDLPFIGNALLSGYPTTYIAIGLVGLLSFLLFQTSSGLRLRAVGENPSAAATVGVKVNRTRYLAVILSGSIAALGGATIVLTSNGNFSFNTISGQGYIALAAVIFGKWNPIGAMLAALFFGLAQAVKDQLQIFDFAANMPDEFFYMLPYVLTLLVLIGAVGKSRAPKALGEPYEVGKR